MEGIEVACGRYPAARWPKARPYFQSWPWHPAGDARRECEKPGSFCAGTFGGASGGQLPETGYREPDAGRRKPAVKRIAIVGGGVSRLAAALTLEEHRRHG